VFAKIIEKVEGYIENRFELIKLEAQEQLNTFIFNTIKVLFLVMIAATVLLLINIALAMYINQLFESRFIGFFFMAGFYAIIFIFVYIYKDSKIINNLITFNPKNATKP